MNNASDINQKTWLQYLPISWQAYAYLIRLDRPIGWWLLLFPAWWSILATGIILDASLRQISGLLALFLLGAVIMRGAGCVINDLWDRNIDQKVARTQNRSIANGTISVRNAFIFLALLSFGGAIIIAQLPLTAIIVGGLSIPLIIIYPLAKRIFLLPQVVLAITFAWGGLLGTAAYGILPDNTAILTYIAAACWIFGFDTIYAIQDIRDDQKIGIKSAAITLGGKLKPTVALTYAAMVFILALAGYLRDAGSIYYFGLIAAAIHLAMQINRIDLSNPKTAASIFKSNRQTGLILTAALMLEYFYR